MDKQQPDRVTFGHLSVPLKIAIIFAYIVGVVYSFLFIIGAIVVIIEGI